MESRILSELSRKTSPVYYLFDLNFIEDYLCQIVMKPKDKTSHDERLHKKEPSGIGVQNVIVVPESTTNVRCHQEASRYFCIC